MLSLFDQIIEANQSIRPYVRITPLDYSPILSQQLDCKVYLKCEHLQQTGSFKFRGAMNKLRLIPEQQRRQGVITASTGNHGQAMAMVGKLIGIPVTVYAPANAAAVKLNAIRSYGGQIVLVQGDALAAESFAREQARREDKIFVSPYNDYDVIAGQGTIGMELIDQLPHLDAIFIAVGGGGLISGIATVIKKRSPTTQIIGCWPANSAAMHHSLQAGRIIEVEDKATLSDGTAGGIEYGSVTFPICQQYIDRQVLVSEYEIQQAMRLLAETDRWMVEGAAGVALASALRVTSEYQGKKIAIVLCGRNIMLNKYLQAIEDVESFFSKEDFN